MQGTEGAFSPDKLCHSMDDYRQPAPRSAGVESHWRRAPVFRQGISRLTSLFVFTWQRCLTNVYGGGVNLPGGRTSVMAGGEITQMKQKVFSFILAGVCAAGLALAEPQQQHERNPAHRVEMLSKRLNLTADQQAKLLPIITDRRQQIRAVFNDSTLSKEDRMAKIRTIRSDSDAKIEALLTDEQKQN